MTVYEACVTSLSLFYSRKVPSKDVREIGYTALCLKTTMGQG